MVLGQHVLSHVEMEHRLEHERVLTQSLKMAEPTVREKLRTRRRVMMEHVLLQVCEMALVLENMFISYLKLTTKMPVVNVIQI